MVRMPSILTIYGSTLVVRGPLKLNKTGKVYCQQFCWV